jgi:alpha-ribazole phosphatase
MQLYLIRHPQPRDGVGRCYGRSDVSVDPAAVQEAAQDVRGRIPDSVLRESRIFSSPSARCVLLARELAAPRAPTLVDDLQEMNFGAWEGQHWGDVPREELNAWAADVWCYRPGGAESAAMVAERWRRWSAAFSRSHAAAAVAVTHAGVIRVALSCAGRLSAASVLQETIAYGSVHCLELACDAP